MAYEKYIGVKFTDQTTGKETIEVVALENPVTGKVDKILGLTNELVFTTLETYFDLVQRMGTNPLPKNKMYLIKRMEEFAKYEPSSKMSFKDNEEALVVIDDQFQKHFIKLTKPGIETLGSYSDFADKVNAGVRNELYKIEDMAGQDGYADNQAAFFHVDGAGNIIDISRQKVFSKTAGSLIWPEVQEQDFSVGGGTSGSSTATPSLSFGDLEIEAERHSFMENSIEGQRYSLSRGSEHFWMAVTTKTGTGATDADEVVLRGTKLDDSSLSPHTFKVKRTGLSNDVVLDINVRKAFAQTVELPANYGPTQFMPKAPLEQLLIDGRSSNDFDQAYTLIANQVERKLTGSNTAMEWRHGDAIKTTTVASGHPIQEGMTINFFDDYNNWIPVLYDDSKVQHAILKYPERTIKVDLAVEKITDWDNTWTGAGTPTGTDNGWKVTFSNPKLASDNSASTFPHNSNPLEMKLISVSSGGTTTAPVNVPKSFISKVDNLLGERSENKEMWMQYNVADVLGNTWLSYTRNTQQDIILPSNKTIYDIEGVYGYSNNKERWYNDYSGENLPSQLSYLTLNNYDIFGADTKIDVELHRSDDQTNGTFTEFLNLELRPVIENGVININKVNIKNKGIFTGGPGSNLKALVDTVTDANKELQNSAHIHYINIRFRGGK